MDKETNDLVEGLRRENRQAQQHVLQQYGEMVFAQVARIVPRQEDAEEVWQDVFVKVFRSIATYNQLKASLPTWISRIAYHEALNFVRHTTPQVIYIDDRKADIDYLYDRETDQALQHPNEQTVQLLGQALDHLSPEEQALITMFYYDNMSIKDIAFVTDSNPSTIGSQLSRTRRKLYRIIKPFLE